MAVLSGSDSENEKTIKTARNTGVYIYIQNSKLNCVQDQVPSLTTTATGGHFGLQIKKQTYFPRETHSFQYRHHHIKILPDGGGRENKKYTLLNLTAAKN